MKNKHMQMNKVLVMMLCAAMTVESAAAYGADFTDGIEIKTELPEAAEDLTEPETQKTVPEESSEEFSTGVVEQNEEDSSSDDDIGPLKLLQAKKNEEETKEEKKEDAPKKEESEEKPEEEEKTTSGLLSLPLSPSS